MAVISFMLDVETVDDRHLGEVSGELRMGEEEGGVGVGDDGEDIEENYLISKGKWRCRE